MRYLLVYEDEEMYAFTENEFHEHIAAFQDGGFDFEGGVIRESDTIEGLCDGFYLENNDLMYPERFYSYYSMGDNFYREVDGYHNLYRNDFKEYDKNFYGFIETNKGLIYIAKMNKEGELVLL